MKQVKPNREQFEEYVSIRNSGVTNMFDITFITEISCTLLTRENCFYIMEHFTELADEYRIAI